MPEKDISPIRIRVSHLLKEIYAELPLVFSKDELKKCTNEYQKRYKFGEASKTKINSSAAPLEVQNNSRGSVYLFTAPEAKVDHLSILAALIRNKKNSYLSHGTALYFHKLTPEPPEAHYLSQAIKAPILVTTAIPQENIDKAFKSAARVTNNYFQYKNKKYYLLEKMTTADKGLMRKRIQVRGKPMVLKITDKERTFIDCIMAPHYCGGINSISKAFNEVALDLEILKKYYDVLNPQYPYWQVIGFILKCISPNRAQKWREYFKEVQTRPFYLHHQHATEWQHCREWNIWHP